MKNEETNQQEGLNVTGTGGYATKKLIPGIFIDPWNQTVSIIEVTDNLDDWRKLLRCKTVECVHLARRGQLPQLAEYEGIDTLDLWCDEEFLLKDTPDPGWRFYYPGREPEVCEVIFGYGLIIGGQNRTGASVGFPIDLMALPVFCMWLRLAFETREGIAIRFGGNEFIAERLRSIDAELPGRVRTLSQIEAVIGRQS